MADYYFADDGDDSGAGSEGDPFKTIVKLNTLVLAAGDTVNLKSLSLFNDAQLDVTVIATSGNHVTFQTYGGEYPAIIDGANAQHSVLISGSAAYIDWVNILFSNGDDFRCVGATGSDNITFTRCGFHGGSIACGQLSGDNTNWASAYCYVMDTNGDGFLASSATVASTWTVRHCRFRHVGRRSTGLNIGDALNPTNLGTIKAYDCWIDRCRRAFYGANTSGQNILERSFLDLDDDSGSSGLYIFQSGTGGMRVRNCAINFTGSSAVFLFESLTTGAFDIENCSIRASSTHASSAILVQLAGTTTVRNTSIQFESGWTAQVSATLGGSYVGSNNNYFRVGGASTDKLFQAAAESFDQWIGQRETGSRYGDPKYPATQHSDVSGTRLRVTDFIPSGISTLFLEGENLSLSPGFTDDVFGRTRAGGVAAWTVGAIEDSGTSGLDTVYVNGSTGDNDGAGTFSAPKRTVMAGVFAVNPGGRVVVQYGSGSYPLDYETFGEILAFKEVSVVGEGADYPSTVDLSSTIVPTIQSALTTSPGLWLTDATDFSLGSVYYLGFLDVNPHTVFDPDISGSDIRAVEVSSSSSLVAGKLWWDSTNSRLYYMAAQGGSPNPNPGSRGVRVAVRQDAVVDLVGDVVLENIRLAEWGSGGIRLGGTERSRVHRNLFALGAGPAVRAASGTARAVIERNKARLVGETPTSRVVNAQSAVDHGVIRLEETLECVVRHNDVDDYSGSGVLVHDSAGNNLVVLNKLGILSFGSARGAITVTTRKSGSRDFILRNLVNGAGGHAVFLESSENVLVGRNTVYNCIAGLVLGKTAGSPEGRMPRSCILQGNIVSETGKAAPSGLSPDTDWVTFLTDISPANGALLNDAAAISSAALTDAEKIDLATNTWRGNRYHRSPSVGTGDDPRFRFGDEYGDFGWWQDRASGWDESSAVGSPGFVDASSGDFHLDVDAGAAEQVEPLEPLMQGYAPALAFPPLLSTLEDQGAFDIEAPAFDPRTDLLVALTGRDVTLNAVDAPGDPDESLGGATTVQPLAVVLSDLKQLWDHPAGDGLTDGVVQYRAVDLVNVAVTPSSSATVTNFDTQTGTWEVPAAYISTLTESEKTALALGWEADAGSPDYQGPLASDAEAPSGVVFTSPTTLAAAAEAPGAASPVVLVPLGVIRLWLRRTVSADAETWPEDDGAITLTGLHTAGGVS